MNYKKTIYTKMTYKIVALTVALAFSFNMAVPQIVAAETEADIVNQGTCSVNPVTQAEDKTQEPIDEQAQMKKWVLNRVQEAGLEPHIVNIILNCESKWNPDAMGVNTNKSVDLGLWQINSIHKDISNADKLDYKKATEWAIDKRLKDGNWNAWYCARRLVYKNY